MENASGVVAFAPGIVATRAEVIVYVEDARGSERKLDCFRQGGTTHGNDARRARNVASDVISVVRSRSATAT